MVANPNVTRSRLVLEIASEMIGGTDWESVPDYFQAKAVLRPAKGGKPVTLYGSSTAEGIRAVVAREVDLGIINPSAVLSAAVLGKGEFTTPQPVKAIAVIPSWDQFVFAVRPETGLDSLEDIARKKPKLNVIMRGMQDHTLHGMFDDIAAAAGFSRADLAAWGGGVQKTGALPWRGRGTFEKLIAGECDAVFDEAASFWVDDALASGIKILSLSEATVQKCEALGYRRAILPKKVFQGLPADVLTIDYSGWTVFVHAEADDKLVTEICTALDARKANIPWEGEGPLPIERMALEAEDTPQTVALHPAAEKFWRSKGYLA